MFRTAERYLAICDERAIPMPGGYREHLDTVAEVERARLSFARLINADADEVAVTSSVSQAVSALASALRFDGQRRQVLASGAETFGYRSVQPDFGGHELCTDQSYVQGPDDPAPLHPNARGHLVIALADERALLEEA